MRVLPDVAGIDRAFDYLVPPRWAGVVEVGSVVRADLHGRRIGGWVTEVGATPPAGVALRPLARVRGLGPDAGLVGLAGWAAWRWAGRRATLLETASPERAVTGLPAPRLRPPAPPAAVPVDLAAPAPGQVTIARIGPATDLTPLVAAVAQLGPTLVVVPALARAGLLADRLSRAGADVALLPGGWAQARAGAGVVIGSRAAAWAPCPGLAAVVVVDGHDPALVQEQAPTWSAVAVAAERARRAGVPCIVTSPAPTVALLDLAGGASRPPVLRADPAAERMAWSRPEVVDQREVDPRLGLWSERVVDLARGGGRVAAVLHRTGRARLLACGACRSVARCERCGAAVAEVEEGELACARCGTRRPVVCLVCGSGRLRRLRLGVTRAAEQLEALVGRPVLEVAGPGGAPVPDGPVLAIGTEAVLHRVGRADAVAFLDFDQHLLAPRYGAAEEALGLLARASRLLGGRRRGGSHLVVQTRLPDHGVLRAAAAGDPALVTDAEAALRAELGLPPAAALAVVSGPPAAAWATEVVAEAGGAVELVALDGNRGVLRAATHRALCDALGAVARPAGRLRVEVDPLAL